MSSPVVIALGGNQGDVQACGQAALAQLDATPSVMVAHVSRWYSTTPVGCTGRFLNAAALLHCELMPSQLLRRMHEIEANGGRHRTGHWSPRPIDLDLVLYGNWQIRHPGLSVPHPAAWYRRFVLDPACEVAGAMIHPDFGQSLHQLRDTLRCRPLSIAWQPGFLWRERLIQELQERHPTHRIDWQAHPNASVVEFGDLESVRHGWRRIGLPTAFEQALQTADDILTAILDEPQAIDSTAW